MDFRLIFSNVPGVSAARAAEAEAKRRWMAADGQSVERARDARARASLAAAWLQRLDTRKAELDATLAAQVAAAAAHYPVEILGGFDDPRWRDWQPPSRPRAVWASYEKGKPRGTALRMGYYPTSGAQIPAFVPFFGADTTLILRSDAAHHDAARRLLQALVVRIAAQLPQQVRFTLLDPVGYGRTFPMAAQLPALRPPGDDLASDLRQVLQDIRRLMKDVIGFHERFDRLPAEIQANERFEVIVAADFPKARAYDRRTIEALAEISRVGPQAGRYLIVHQDLDAPLPRDAEGIAFENRWVLNLANESFVPDALSDATVATRVLSVIRGAKPVETSAGVGQLLPPESEWWTGTSADALVAPIGSGSSPLPVRFDGSLKSHALVSAAAGGGKSNLLHALVLGLCTRYSPDEVELYLIDLKEGVEFGAYRTLPHAAVVSLNTDPELARAVVGDLCAELKRRLEMFGAAQVQDLASYRKAGSPGGPLPRILLIVDEYQQLFRDAADDRVSDDLRLIATQGRAPGVHMLLASQTAVAPPGMLHARHIMDNVLTRIVLRLRPDAIAGLTDFGPRGREMIRGCDQPGKVVINDQGGDDGANRFGKVALVDAAERDRVIRRLSELARPRSGRRGPQVFDGRESPSVEEHAVVMGALRAARPLDSATLAGLARRRWADGGFDRSDWRDGDRPIPVWIGRQQHIHGHAAVLLSRRDGAHLLAVGGASDGTRGMLAGVLSSLAAGADPEWVDVDILAAGDRDALLDSFAALASMRRLEVRRHEGPAATAARIRELAGDLASDATAAARSRVVLLLDPDEAPELRRPADPLSRERPPALDALRRLLADGPRAGIHLLVFLRSPRVVGSVFDDRRGDLRLVRWRAAVQMSEEDSRRLFDQAAVASRLPERTAVLQDIERASVERFMPYRPALPALAVHEGS